MLSDAGIRLAIRNPRRISGSSELDQEFAYTSNESGDIALIEIVELTVVCRISDCRPSSDLLLPQAVVNTSVCDFGI